MSDSSPPPNDRDQRQTDAIGARLQEIVEQRRREREANNAPRLERNTLGILKPAELLPPCPFPHVLLGRRFGLTGIPLTTEEQERCRDARSHLPDDIVERASIVCVPSSIPPDTPLAYRTTIQHAEVLARGYRVHVEWISQALDAPGGSNDELRVYVGRTLRGRSICLGRLGACVNSLPATANIDDDFALTVAWVHRDGNELAIELRACRSLDHIPERQPLADGPLTVAAGILNQSEFSRLRATERVEVDNATRRLLETYGLAWLHRERDRLRAEIDLAYGVSDTDR